MENPFETGHIKNYILAYSSVVVIMVLFFLATTLFHDIEIVEKKEFISSDKNNIIEKKNRILKNVVEINHSRFKLIDTNY